MLPKITINKYEQYIYEKLVLHLLVCPYEANRSYHYRLPYPNPYFLTIPGTRNIHRHVTILPLHV